MPVDVRGLAILLVEKERRKEREIYIGNLQWSTLNAIYGLANKSIKVPSYGDIYEAQYGKERPKQTKEELQDEMNTTLDNMLAKYQRKGR
ncbi:MAG: hypothetical protein WC455_23640 [Dehalococcoidia bacterium]